MEETGAHFLRGIVLLDRLDDLLHFLVDEHLADGVEERVSLGDIVASLVCFLNVCDGRNQRSTCEMSRVV